MSNHLRQFAFFYTIITYIIFALSNQFVFKWWDDPYGIAMVIIGLFWLAVQRSVIYFAKDKK